MSVIGLLLFLFIALLVVIGIVFPVWAIVDICSRPESSFKTADQNRIAWLLVVLLLWLVGAVLWFAIGRPKLKVFPQVPVV